MGATLVEAAGAGRHAPERVSRGGFSATGPHRARNEDAFSLAPGGPGEARYGTLCALADGVGSRPGGDTASRDAVYYLQALYYAAAGPPAPGERLRRSVEAVNWLGRTAAEHQGGTEALTTLVAAVVVAERVWVANVGDSRAYLVRARTGECRRLTEDHSQAVLVPGEAQAAPGPGPAQPAEAGAMADEGATVRSKPAAAPRPAVTRAITRAIGLEPTSQMDLYTYAWEPGDRLVLCSDGLAAVPPDQIAQLALSMAPATAARQLVTEALRVDGTDNATAVVLGWEVAPEPGRREATGAQAARPTEASSRLPLGLAVALVALALGVGLALGWLSAAAFLAWGA